MSWTGLAAAATILIPAHALPPDGCPTTPAIWWATGSAGSAEAGTPCPRGRRRAGRPQAWWVGNGSA